MHRPLKLIGLLGLAACATREAADAVQPRDAAAPLQAPGPSARDDGSCRACDSTPPAAPVLAADGGTGNVTTYGNVFDPEPSRGGACNYQDTAIEQYAAIHVNVELGDGRGPWQAGRICGQCALVRARTPEGWRQTVVRIVDKCPDEYCGIDLGGAPARAIMGTQPGRYQGTWRFISCAGQAGVSDAPPSLYVKDGSNPYWALVQVRNPSAAVQAIDWESADGVRRGTFPYASEAENYFSVPEPVRMSAETIRLHVKYRDATQASIALRGSELALPGASYPLD